MRRPDINRVARAHDHVSAAMTVLNSIKDENMDAKETMEWKEIYKELKFAGIYLEKWKKELEERQ